MSKLQNYIQKQREEVNILDKKTKELFMHAYKTRNETENKKRYIKELSYLDIPFKWRKSKQILRHDTPYIYYSFSFYLPYTYSVNKQDIYIYLYNKNNNKKYKWRVKVDSMLDMNDYSDSYHKSIQVNFLQATYTYDITNNSKDNYYNDIVTLDKINKNFKTKEEAEQYISSLMQQYNKIIRDNSKFKEFIKVTGEEYDKLDTIVDGY